VAQHRPTGSETTPAYTPRSSRFGSEPTSVEDDGDVWRYAIVSCTPETTTTIAVMALLLMSSLRCLSQRMFNENYFQMHRFSISSAVLSAIFIQVT